MVDTTANSMGSGAMNRPYQDLFYPPKTRRSWWEYGVTLATVLMAFLVRWAMDWVLLNNLPFVTFLIAVMVTTWYGGVVASFTAIVLGGLISNWFFVQPRYQFSQVGLVDQAGMVIYLAISFTTVGFIQTWKWAWRQTDRMTKELHHSMRSASPPEQ